MINIYEVMAIENGYPLFFLEHIIRLQKSINNLKHYNIEDLVSIAVDLIKPELKNSKNKNLKLTYSVELDSFSLEIKEPLKPTEVLYKQGATLGLLKAERDTPLIKKENLSQRKLSDELCSKHGYYDVLLENKNCEITEGSRSNFLGIDKDGNVLTSPIGTALNGVTRETIFDICRDKKITIIQKVLTKKSLSTLESFILTGTSPGILPISSCENINFSVKNKVTELLVNEFNNRKIRDLYITKEFFK